MKYSRKESLPLLTARPDRHPNGIFPNPFVLLHASYFKQITIVMQNKTPIIDGRLTM